MDKDKIIRRISELEIQLRNDARLKKQNICYGMDGLQSSYLEGQLVALKDVLYDRLYK